MTPAEHVKEANRINALIRNPKIEAAEQAIAALSDKPKPKRKAKVEVKVSAD